MKALEKIPKNRYQKVRDLKRDIQRYQEGFGVSAHKDSLLESSLRWMKRNKIIAGSILALVVILLAISGWLSESQQRSQISERLSKLHQEEKKLKENISQMQQDVLKIQKLKENMEKENQNLLVQNQKKSRELEKKENDLAEQKKRLHAQSQELNFKELLAEMHHQTSLGRFDRVEEIFRQLVQNGHRVGLVYSNMAMFYLKWKQVDKAYEMLKKSQTYKRFPEQSHGLITVCVQLGKIEEAQEEILHYIKNYSHFPLLPEVYYLQAQIYNQQKNLQKTKDSLVLGIQSVQKMKLKTWKYIPHCYALGEIYLAEGNKTQAIQYFEAVVKAESTPGFEQYINFAQQKLNQIK
jgi:tetratricopeptide (TPR) repeat protein